MSPSTTFEGISISKHAVLMEFALLLCRLMLGRGNRAGAMIFSSGIDRIIPSRGGRHQLLEILPNNIESYRSRAGVTDLGKVLSDGLHVVRRRSLIFVVSHFISTPNWEKPLSLLSARHDVIAVKFDRPWEFLVFPILGLSPSRMQNWANSFWSTPTIKAFGRALPLTRKQSKTGCAALLKRRVWMSWSLAPMMMCWTP